jgi:hypothetical protein
VVSLNKLFKMKKISLLLVVFSCLSWSGLSAQGFPISVIFSNLDPTCNVTVTGTYQDSLTGAQGSLFFLADPSGNFSTTLLMNAFSQATFVTVCAEYCSGAVECQTLPIVPGAITTFTFGGNGGGIIDYDGDGFNSTVDCNDNDPTINGNATEVCDAIDNNCDGIVDEGCNAGGCSLDIVLVPDSLVNSPFAVYIYMANADPSASFIWSFGNGNTAAVAYPTWVYDSLGTYTVCCTVAFPDGCTATDCVTFTVNSDGSMSPGGIQMQGFTLNVVNEMPIANGVNVIEDKGLTAFPNPFENNLIIESNAAITYYQVISTQGQLVIQGTANGQHWLSVDTENLNSGVYFLNVVTKEGSEVRKVLKK